MQNRLQHILFLAFLSITASALGQYTELINSNRPGESQGAYAVGANVLQFEVGYSYGEDTHDLLNTKRSINAVDATLKYGLLFEALEISLRARQESHEIDFLVGNVESFKISGFTDALLGAKYLFFDPQKHLPEELPNLYSYHDNFKFKWRHIIPSISVYGGVRLDFTGNPSIQSKEDGFFGVVALITQNNWNKWVLVNNIIVDRITAEYMSTSWIATLTRSFNPRFATFGEYQVIKNELYSDNIARGGFAYLFTKDFQVDISGLYNFKNTPSRWNLGLGLSYRIDMHKEDELIKRDGDDENTMIQQVAPSQKRKKKKPKSKN